MIVPESYKYCNEIYTVEKTVEVVVKIKEEPQTIRIEAYRSMLSERYSTRAFRKEHITAQPTFPQEKGHYTRPPHDFEMWVDYDLPRTDGDDADQVLSQALGFLGRNCDKE